MSFLSNIEAALPAIERETKVAVALEPIGVQLAADAVAAVNDPSVGIVKFATDLVTKWRTIVAAITANTAPPAPVAEPPAAVDVAAAASADAGISIASVLKSIACAVALGAGLMLSACAPSGPVTPASVCGDIQAAKSAPDAATQLNALDPHSALGVLWADAQSGCIGAMPVAGVDASWTQQVWAMAKGLIPTVLPLLIGLI